MIQAVNLSIHKVAYALSKNKDLNHTNVLYTDASLRERERPVKEL